MDETTLPGTVVALGDPRRDANWSLLPPPAGVCSMCAKDHDPELPHDWQSLYWQYGFYAEYSRWPDVDDAFAHCDDEMHEAWREALAEHGVTLTPRHNQED